MAIYYNRVGVKSDWLSQDVRVLRGKHAGCSGIVTKQYQSGVLEIDADGTFIYAHQSACEKINTGVCDALSEKKLLCHSKK